MANPQTFLIGGDIEVRRLGFGLRRQTAAQSGRGEGFAGALPSRDRAGYV
jgi:hypothetical protein